MPTLLLKISFVSQQVLFGSSPSRHGVPDAKVVMMGLVWLSTVVQNARVSSSLASRISVVDRFCPTSTTDVSGNASWLQCDLTYFQEGWYRQYIHLWIALLLPRSRSPSRQPTRHCPGGRWCPEEVVVLAAWPCTAGGSVGTQKLM